MRDKRSDDVAGRTRSLLHYGVAPTNVNDQVAYGAHLLFLIVIQTPERALGNVFFVVAPLAAVYAMAALSALDAPARGDRRNSAGGPSSRQCAGREQRIVSAPDR